MSLFDYKDADAIGEVTSVDTGRVVVRVSNEEKLRRLQVNHLVALRSSRAGQHHVGIIEKILRRAVDAPADSIGDEDIPEGQMIAEDVIRVTLVGTLLDRSGDDKNVFRRTLESVPEIASACFVVDGPRLTAFMKAVTASRSGDTSALRLGTYTLDENAEAWLDGNRFFQRHAVIVGSTGSGKSWAVARILEQVAALPSASAVLFDLHGEYSPLNAAGMKHFRVAGPGDAGAKDPRADGVLFLPYWLLTYEEMLALLLDRSDDNAPNQAMLFAREVTTAKRAWLEKEKRKEVLANFTVDSPVYYGLDRVLEELEKLDNERIEGAKPGTEKNGPFNGKLTRFIQRLSAKQADRRLTFLFGGGASTQSYSWFEDLCSDLMSPPKNTDAPRVRIIDFSEVPSDVLPLITGLVARVLFTVQQWIPHAERHPLAIFCDEAHLYIPERADSSAVLTAGLQAFERIAKEGRKYGIGLVVVSQRPSEVNRTVLSQCSNFVSMRLSNAEDQGVIKRLLPDSLGGFSDLLPVLDVGEALVVGDASLLPSRIRVDIPTTRPVSATVQFWDRWSQKSAKSAVPAGVESLRRQSQQR